MDSKQFTLIYLASFIVVAGCEPIRQDTERAKREVKSTVEKVKKDLKTIQLHGEVDLEVMTQLTAVNEAYRKFVATNGRGPDDWPDLVGVASQGISVQDAQRQGAFVRFGMTPAELADEKKQQELLLAIKSANDDSIWGVNFGGDVVKVPDSVYTQLKSSN